MELAKNLTVIGLSGGLDSSYATYVATKKMGLRPLLFHVDAGWNTDRAVGNIASLVDGLGVELFTEVVDWNSVKRMQLAFLKAGIADQDLVQDAAFFATLYRFAREHGIKHIITGSNYSTECCREPEEWGGYLGIDSLLFKDIWRKHGDGEPIPNFPMVDLLVYKCWLPFAHSIKVHHPLNMVEYYKAQAEKDLSEKFGWEPFQHKHHESRFTRFFEDYWLPQRFGYDNRKAHLSSLIMTGQLSRSDALLRVASPEMDQHFLSQEFGFVASKLGLSEHELQRLFEMPKRTFRSFRNKRSIVRLGVKLLSTFGKERRFSL